MDNYVQQPLRPDNLAHFLGNASVFLICVVNIFSQLYFATLGGFLFGFDSGVINGTVDGLRIAFDSDEVGTGFNVASMLLGCAVGAFVAGRLSDILGRKRTLLIAAAFFIISAYGSGIAGSSGEFVIYRIIGGLAVGAASVLAPAYISEVTPAAMRGRLSSLQQVMIIPEAYTKSLAGDPDKLEYDDFEAFSLKPARTWLVVMKAGITLFQGNWATPYPLGNLLQQSPVREKRSASLSRCNAPGSILSVSRLRRHSIQTAHPAWTVQTGTSTGKTGKRCFATGLSRALTSLKSQIPGNHHPRSGKSLSG